LRRCRGERGAAVARARPYLRPRLLRLERDHDMDALAAGEEGEALEADRLERAPHLEGSVPDLLEPDTLSGIEVEGDSVRPFMVRQAGPPAVELDGIGLDAGEQPLAGVDIEIVLGPAVLLEDRHLVDRFVEAALGLGVGSVAL